MVLSIPTEAEAPNVRGHYMCVEVVQELEDGIEVISVLNVCDFHASKRAGANS
jgi:hypothetical protein